jgi:hypothetical protein
MLTFRCKERELVFHGNSQNKKIKKALTPQQKKYQQLVKETLPKPTIMRNAILAFVFGGFVCIIG